LPLTGPMCNVADRDLPLAHAMPSHSRDESGFGPWKPGVESEIPASLLPLATVYRPENVSTPLAQAREFADLTGMAPCDLVAFRPERLALHELLVRTNANVSIPDGERIEDLGINFRRIARVLLERHVAPQADAIVAAYDDARRRIEATVGRELAPLFGAATVPAEAPRAGLFARLFGRRGASPREDAAPPQPEAAIAAWDARARTSEDFVERAALHALSRTVTAVVVRHGALWGDAEALARIATQLAANDAGSDAIGALLEPVIAQGAAAEGYAPLPRQDAPLVMNTKGPSAAGKSTMRPLQKALAERIGVRWDEFARISPDIWRKQLLDYDSLGDAYKYAGAFTGDELRIIDQKFDRYMARKAGAGGMTHLLIDRFRFDSFAPDSDEAGSNLLTRFGHVVYMFFLVTPPAALVERAWNRGNDVGRYKAVDDTLAHGVEAYSGMPGLFFTWVARRDKRVHFEFLDNTVARGEPPRSAAFGWNDTLNVLDVSCLLDIERFRKVDIDARSSDALYPDPSVLAPERNAEFLAACVARFRVVNFADQASGRIWLSVVEGRPAWADQAALRRALADPDVRAGLAVAVPALSAATPSHPAAIPVLAEEERRHTVGDWGAGQSL